VPKKAAIARKVLDSWAILSWLKGARHATDAVRRILEDSEHGRVELQMNIINVGEVFYILAKNAGPQEAEDFLRDFRQMPLKSVSVPKALVLAAARLKAKYPISYADAIAAETAVRAGAALVTGDPDFKRFIGGDLVQVEWIGT
jgi:predicted nucleic acid-binding protein